MLIVLRSLVLRKRKNKQLFREPDKKWCSFSHSFRGFYENQKNKTTKIQKEIVARDDLKNKKTKKRCFLGEK